ncbi:tetratricopeptide repeat protein [Stieleria marina]|uniref:protein O-GlcNAc transferase n=1 Tax=Stieleria marina TaxID=1930275 RepID=A0A517P2G0_9BACT|nr:TPR repeat-containing protein YrrB [Planctomycetes bacterium K23_9]
MPSSHKKRIPKRRKRARVSLGTDDSSIIHEALDHHRRGNYEIAKQIYCKLIAQQPDNADAWHLLGMLLHATDHNTDALECLENAVTLSPNHAEYLSNLGLVYSSVQQNDRALETLRRAVAIAPKMVAARNNLGTLLLKTQQIEAAETQFQAALQIDPDFTVAAVNLGNTWQQLGRVQDAETIYRRCLSREPSNTLALTNLGESLRSQCRWSDAVDALQQAIAINPDLVDTRITLGRTLLNLAMHDEAKQQFALLIEQWPDHPKVHQYMGTTLHELHDNQAAAKTLSTALQLAPKDPYIHVALGFVHLDEGQRDLAADRFRKAIELNPAISDAHSCLLFIMSGDSAVSPDRLLDESRRWGERHGNVEPIINHCDAARKSRNANRRLRIGYVSPDFCSHPVARFIEPILQAHDRQQVEVYCYAEVPVPDARTESLRQLSDHWQFTTGRSNRQVAQLIANDNIDILVDLAGHTSRNRLEAFAFKPAPVQMTWMGYPNTTGLAAIDYRLTCETQNPIDEPSYHVEGLIRMQGGAICFAAPRKAPALQPPPMVDSACVTFGSLHRPFKITPEVQQLWAKVLHAFPRSRLLALSTYFSDETKSNLIQSLIDLGIDAARIEIRDEFGDTSYLNTYHEIDIALDVFPWAGGTTTLEALWMGVPVVARYGDRRSARSTAAIVDAIGQPNWIARSDDEYISIIDTLLKEAPGMSSIRANLRSQTQRTIANADRFTRELENVYQQAWDRWCNSIDEVH